MTKPLPHAAATRVWWLVLAAALLLRLSSLPLAVLTDHTEARYAEIARLMVVLQDWVSPHITPSEVFWAKPPLSTWSQALLMELFGVHAWPGRLAALLWALLALWSMHWMLKGSVSALQRAAMLAGLMLSPLFFLCAGAVMTDATLGATVLLVQAAWWRVLKDEGAGRRRAARVLALGLGLALLTKGPAAAVLALLPILMHAGWRQHWRLVWAVMRDPWVWLIWMAVALPWFVIAELKTPGFLQYFVLGEHVMRFLQPGWKGDRYGFAHAQPLGMIWLFTLVAALPWVLLALARLPWLRWREGRGAVGRQLRSQLEPELISYAACLLLAPLLVFTGARNIIATYALTAMPGLVILALGLLPEASLAGRRLRVYVLLVLALTAWAYLYKLPQAVQRNSDQGLIAAYEKACAGQRCALRYQAKPPYSAYFYTAGRLYEGMPGEPGAPAFAVLPRAAVAADQALACNKDACLVSESAQSADSALSHNSAR